MSREALSLDISQVVARVVSGEPVDTAERGQWLASKYPDLGMSAEMIGQAIDRAAGMMGMIKSAPEPVIPRRADPSLARPAPASSDSIRVIPPSPATSASALPPMPRAAMLIDDDLAAAIDAEISGLVIASRSTTAAPEAEPDARNGSFTPFPRSVPAAPAPQPRERAFTPREPHAVETPTPPRGAVFEPRGAVFEPSYPAGRAEAARAEAERSAFARVRRAFFRH